MPFQRSKNTTVPNRPTTTSSTTTTTKDSTVQESVKKTNNRRPCLIPEDEAKLAQQIRLHHQQWLDNKDPFADQEVTSQGNLVPKKATKEVEEMIEEIVMAEGPGGIDGSGKKNTKRAKGANRCHQCQKKLTLVMQTCGLCPCGGVYCEKHRAASKHDCLHDFKEGHQERLRKENPKIVPDKFEKYGYQLDRDYRQLDNEELEYCIMRLQRQAENDRLHDMLYQIAVGGALVVDSMRPLIANSPCGDQLDEILIAIQEKREPRILPDFKNKNLSDSK